VVRPEEALGMKTWMQLLGKDPSAIPDGADIQFVWTNPTGSWRVFVVLGLLVALWWAVGWLYRRESPSCPQRVRILLAVIRSFVILAVLLILLGPAVGVSLRQTLPPSVVVLLDESLSMSVRDRYRDPGALAAAAAFRRQPEAELRQNPPTRVALVNELLLRDKGAFLKALSAKGKLHLLSFAETTRLRTSISAGVAETPPGGIALEQGGLAPPIEARGPGTNLGRALREAVQSVAGGRIAAVVLVSDGRDTVAEDPQDLAARFGRQGIPVFAIPVGDPSESCNVRVSEVWAPASVPRKDPFALQARIQARHVEAGSLTVELRQSPEDAPETDPGVVVASQNVPVEAGRTAYDIAFAPQPERAGRFRYTVAVVPLPDELLDTDNRRSTRVEVLDQKLRVLLVAGAPSWDYRLVRTLLTRDATMDLSCWLQSQTGTLRQDGTTSLDHLPVTPAELFTYDAVVLMDPAPDVLTAPWLGLLRDFVGKHGGGLLWMAGPIYTGQAQGLPHADALFEMLPVRWKEGSAGRALRGGTGVQEWPLRIRGAGADHPMLSLASDPAQTFALWSTLPGIYWYFPVGAAAPGAQVLMELADPASQSGDAGIPLLVEGQYGAGRVIWMGFAETWRWRRTSEMPFHRFWIQAARELAAGRTLKGGRRGQISAERETCNLGDTVRVTARLFDPAYRPLSAPAIKARVTVAGGGAAGTEIELAAVPAREGLYAGSFLARHLGVCTLRVATEQIGGTPVEAAEGTCTVELPNVEFAEPQLNRGLLQALADASGGACVPLNQTAELARRIPDCRETIVTRGQPIELWDTERVLILLVVLLGIEWFLRKRYHLV
jgi:hypothetical protein